MKKLLNQRGQGMLEYLVIISLVGVGTMGLVRHLSKKINFKMAQVADVLDGKKARENSKEEISSQLLKRKDFSNFFEGAGTGDGND